MEGFDVITLDKIILKAKSKREIYNLLHLEEYTYRQ